MANTVNVLIKADDQASKEIEGVGGSLKKVGEIAAGFITANVIEAGFGKLTSAVNDSIAGFKEQQIVTAQTEAVLRSTAGAAGMSAEQVLTLADSLKQNSLFADDAIQSGENLLLTFTNIGGDTFPRATQAMLDMSQALGQDLGTSAIQLGKALNDPIAGVTSLRRVGVQLNDQQEEQIKAMVAAGDVAGAQAVILAELEKEFGGSAQAASDAAGASAKYDDKMDDLNDTLGEKLLPVQEKFKEAQIAVVSFLLDKGIPAFQQLSEWIQTNVIPAVQDLADWIDTHLVPAFEDFIAFAKPKIEEFAALAQEKFTEFRQYYEENIKPALDNIITGVENVIGFIKEHWPEISAVVMPVIEEIKNIVETHIKIIMDVLNILIQLIKGDWSGAWNGVKELFSDVWKSMQESAENGKQLIEGVLNGLKEIGSAAFGAMKEAALDEFDNLRLGILSTGQEIINALGDVFLRAKNWVGVQFGGLADVVKQPINDAIGYINQLIGAWNGLSFSAGGGSVLGVKIPSVSFGTPDLPYIPYLAKGGIVTGPTLAMIGEAGRPEAVIPLDRAGGIGGGNVYHINVASLDPRTAADLVLKTLVDLERRGGVTPGVTRALA